MAVIIDGKAIAQTLRHALSSRVEVLKDKGIHPRLDVILIGEHPASLIYVRNKQRTAEQLGIICNIHRLDEETPETDVRAVIDQLNAIGSHGILLQLPVPRHLDPLSLLNAIHPSRDVDGLNLVNVGKRTLGLPGLLPCTPKGCLTLIKSVREDLTGLHAVVVGRSDLVGKPLAQLLLRENCTVTQAHAQTKNLAEICRTADILAVAIGKPRFIQGDWIKQGAIVLDIGINSVNRVNGTLCGDVNFAAALPKAGAITPVPGGVGPMTIVSLMENTVSVAENSQA